MEKVCPPHPRLVCVCVCVAAQVCISTATPFGEDVVNMPGLSFVRSAAESSLSLLEPDPDREEVVRLITLGNLATSKVGNEDRSSVASSNYGSSASLLAYAKTAGVKGLREGSRNPPRQQLEDEADA